MDLLSAAIFLSGLLCAYLLFRRASETGGSGTTPPGATEILPTLYIYQLNPKTKEQDNRYELNDVVMKGDGYTISGNNCRRGMIKLSGRYQESRWVSCEHATVYLDEDGYYIQDNDSVNGTRLPGSAVRETRIKIENGMVVYLGLQPIQFVFVDNIGERIPDDRAGDQAGANRVNVREKPRRIHPVNRRR